jgi:hypothetical protein
MFGWEWEDFEDQIASRQPVITAAGPLNVPIRSSEIRRDEKLALRMLVRSPQYASGERRTALHSSVNACTPTSITSFEPVLPADGEL